MKNKLHLDIMSNYIREYKRTKGTQTIPLSLFVPDNKDNIFITSEYDRGRSYNIIRTQYIHDIMTDLFKKKELGKQWKYDVYRLQGLFRFPLNHSTPDLSRNLIKMIIGGNYC